MKKTNNKAGRRQKRPIIYPSPIQKGDTIGLVAPAGSLISKDTFAAGIQFLEKRGFNLKFNRKLLDSIGYLAGSDQERADDFNGLWGDPDVKAIVAARGGYGSLRMIDLLDMKQIRKKPKIFIGFSDLTVLLNAIRRKTKLVTFHGPVVTTLASIDRQSRTSFFDVLTKQMPGQIKSSGIKVLKGGRAKGFLYGGNLTTLVHTIGTPYEIPWIDSILFIEDIGESPYRLDRLLTHLDKAGCLQKINGLLIGSFADNDKKERAVLHNTVQKRITEILNGRDIPVWTNFPTGHCKRNITLPVGAEVKMDSHSGILKLL
jgi:muramoyltetrapeptide carboxypeptidase